MGTPRRKLLLPGQTSPALQGPPSKPQGAVVYSASLIVPGQTSPALQGPPSKPQGARYAADSVAPGSTGFVIPPGTTPTGGFGTPASTGSSPGSSGSGSGANGIAGGVGVIGPPTGGLIGPNGQPIPNNTPFIQYVPPPPPALPAPGSFRDKIAARFGYVPRTAILTQTSYTQTLAAQVAQQQAAIPSLQQAVGTLQAQQTALQNQLAQANSQIASLQSQITSVQNQISVATANAASVGAEVGTLQAQLASLQSAKANLGTAIQSAQSQISSIQASIAGVAASPSQSANPSNTSQDPSDPSYTGFAPLGVNFGAGYSGLATSGGGVIYSATRASPRPRFASVGSGLGGFGSVRDQTFSRMGYVPAAQLGSVVGQAGALQSQLGTLATQGNALRSQGVALNAAIPQLQAKVAAANAQIPSLQGQLSSLQGQLASITGGTGSVGPLQSAISSAQADIANLTAQWTSVTNELTAWRTGGFPFNVSWSFGDGGTDTSNNQAPSHVFSAGSFTPSVTVSVTTPDGTVHSHTFSLPGLLIGQWPTGLTIGPVNSNYFSVTVVDSNGNAIANTRVEATLTETVDLLTHPKTTAITGSNGSFGIQVPSLYARGTWSVKLRSLRNPTVTNTAS